MSGPLDALIWARAALTDQHGHGTEHSQHAPERAPPSGRDSSGHDSHSSDDGHVVIVGMMTEASMESVVLGMAVTATVVVVVATMTVFAAVAHAPLAMMVMAGAMTASYGLRAAAMVMIGMASSSRPLKACMEVMAI